MNTEVYYWLLVYKETTLCDYVNKLVNLTSSMKETVQKYQFTGGENYQISPLTEGLDYRLYY